MNSQKISLSSSRSRRRFQLLLSFNPPVVKPTEKGRKDGDKNSPFSGSSSCLSARLSFTRGQSCILLLFYPTLSLSPLSFLLRRSPLLDMEKEKERKERVLFPSFSLFWGNRVSVLAAPATREEGRRRERRRSLFAIATAARRRRLQRDIACEKGRKCNSW